MKSKTRFLCQAAIIAALYVVLTCNPLMASFANHAIQLRFSEALCVLPIFTPAAIPGLFIGCFVSNLLTFATFPFWENLVFGSLATLIGAFGTYFLRKHKFLAIIPPILSNTIIVPLILLFTVGGGTLPFFVLTVGIGEILSVGGLGIPFMLVLGKTKNLFKL